MYNGKTKAIEFKKEELMAKQNWNSTLNYIYNDVHHPYLQEVVGGLAQQMIALEDIRMEGIHMCSQTKWMDRGD